jgi:cell division protein FtsB
MKKILIMVIVCSISLVTACTNTKETVIQLKEDKEKLTASINESEKNQEKLNQTIMELKKQIEVKEKEKELFSTVSNLSRDFVNAHTSGNKEKLKSMISGDLFLEEKDNKLYINNHAYDQWLLFPYDGQQLDDWLIQSYEFHNESNTYSVHIREFYKNVDGELESPPRLLNLTFKFHNNEWEIVSVNFEV